MEPFLSDQPGQHISRAPVVAMGRGCSLASYPENHFLKHGQREIQNGEVKPASEKRLARTRLDRCGVFPIAALLKDTSIAVLCAQGSINPAQGRTQSDIPLCTRGRRGRVRKDRNILKVRENVSRSCLSPVPMISDVSMKYREIL